MELTDTVIVEGFPAGPTQGECWRQHPITEGRQGVGAAQKGIFHSELGLAQEDREEITAVSWFTPQEPEIAGTGPKLEAKNSAWTSYVGRRDPAT